jgi:hypothetical protein
MLNLTYPSVVNLPPKPTLCQAIFLYTSDFV